MYMAHAILRFVPDMKCIHIDRIPFYKENRPVLLISHSCFFQNVIDSVGGEEKSYLYCIYLRYFDLSGVCLATVKDYIFMKGMPI